MANIGSLIRAADVESTEVWVNLPTLTTIDQIDPTTGLTVIFGRDPADVLREYPDAIRMSWDAFLARKAASQHTAVLWTPTTAEQYDEMLNCLPPALWTSAGFLVGEPWDHDAETGRPRFQAFVAKGGEFFTASRPMTRAEFRALTSDEVTR